MIVTFFFCTSRDEDLLDQDIKTPTMTADVLIEIAKIQWAAEKLRESTAFLKDFEILSEDFPVIRTSINNLIAGPDRTIADLFDLTGEDFLFRYIFCDTPTENCIFFPFILKIGPTTWKGLKLIL